MEVNIKPVLDADIDWDCLLEKYLIFWKNEITKTSEYTQNMHDTMNMHFSERIKDSKCKIITINNDNCQIKAFCFCTEVENKFSQISSFTCFDKQCAPKLFSEAIKFSKIEGLTPFGFVRKDNMSMVKFCESLGATSTNEIKEFPIKPWSADGSSVDDWVCLKFT